MAAVGRREAQDANASVSPTPGRDVDGGVDGRGGRVPRRRMSVAVRPEAQNADAKAVKADAEKPGDEDKDDDEEESNVSVAAMEMALKPIVLETCDLIAKTYKRFRKVRDVRMQAAMKHQELAPRSVQKALQAMGQAFRMAEGQGRISSNPLAGVTFRDFYKGKLRPKPAALSRVDG